MSNSETPNSESLERLDVVMVSLGTPEELSVPAIRQFLKRFLSDKRVVEAPRAVWFPVLYGFILPFRPRSLKDGYAHIWKEYGGSPLRVIANEQVAAMQKKLAATEQLKGVETHVHQVMLYDKKNVTYKLHELTAIYQKEPLKRQKMIILPLYPQYSATTTGAVYDQMFDAFKKERSIPQHHFIRNYFSHALYRRALAGSVKEFWEKNGQADYLLMSFHGIPQDCVDKGDPYYVECVKTAQNLQQDLLLNETQAGYSFQSRLGPKQWLQPYTDKTVESLAKKGIKKLDIVCPSFSADCLETLEEISIENGEIFLENGGEKLRLIPCLNTQESHIDLFHQLILESI